jgi:hypothetical protein
MAKVSAGMLNETELLPARLQAVQEMAQSYTADTDVV